MDARAAAAENMSFTSPPPGAWKSHGCSGARPRAENYHAEEPFGVELYPTDQTTNNIKYTGQEEDACTGNLNLNFRMYQDAIGRFLKPDNIAGNAWNPQSFNRYSYVGGNPVTFVDPWGHAPMRPGGGAATWYHATAFGPTVLFPQSMFTGGGSAYSVSIGAIFYGGTVSTEQGTYRWSDPDTGKTWTYEPPQETSSSYNLSFDTFLYGAWARNWMSDTRVVSHLGIWRYRGQQQAGIGFAKTDYTWVKSLVQWWVNTSQQRARVAETYWALTEITTVFEYNGHYGLAIEPQMMPQPDPGSSAPIYTEKPTDKPHAFVNPYNVPSFGLGTEPLGQSLNSQSRIIVWY